jgi:hypothetical protein
LRASDRQRRRLITRSRQRQVSPSLRVGTHQGWDFAGRNVMLYSDGATGSGVWPKLHWCLCARLRVWLPALADLTLVKWAHEMRVPLSRSGDYRSFSAPAQPVAHRWSDAWNSLAFCISCMSRPYTGRGKGGCVVGPPKNTSIYVSQEGSDCFGAPGEAWLSF